MEIIPKMSRKQRKAMEGLARALDYSLENVSELPPEQQKEAIELWPLKRKAKQNKSNGEPNGG